MASNVPLRIDLQGWGILFALFTAFSALHELSHGWRIGRTGGLSRDRCQRRASITALGQSKVDLNLRSDPSLPTSSLVSVSQNHDTSNSRRAAAHRGTSRWCSLPQGRRMLQNPTAPQLLSILHPIPVSNTLNCLPMPMDPTTRLRRRLFPSNIPRYSHRVISCNITVQISGNG